jgi:hypothetical protein
MTLHRFATSHVLGRLIRGASSSPVVVETAGGRFVTKLRGSGAGVPALIAEIIVAELSECLGLPVPERVLIELEPDFRSDDRNDELADLLARSVGENLGFRFLDRARLPRPEELRTIDDDFALRVLWLDGLTENVDRTETNPNILLWNGRPFLIDHGAALPFHNDWSRVTEDSPREPMCYAGHVFESRVALLPRIDTTLARALTRRAVELAMARVPDSWLAGTGHEPASRARAAYGAFLWKRLKAPRPFASPSP